MAIDAAVDALLPVAKVRGKAGDAAREALRCLQSGTVQNSSSS